MNSDKNSKNNKTDHLELETCPFDSRFPHTNQTKHCFLSFVDFQKCSRLLGDYEGCEQLKRCYKSICPNEWVAQWEEQIENGTFPVKLPSYKKENLPQDEKTEKVDENSKSS